MAKNTCRSTGRALSKASILSLSVFFLLSLMFSTPAYSLVVSTDQIEYVSGDTISIEGILSSTNESGEVSIVVYNSTGSLTSESNVTSSGGETNYFSKLLELDGNYTPGEYLISIISDEGAVNLSFSVVSEKISYKSRMIGNFSIIEINTSTEANDSIGGNNFSDPLEVSKSGILHYGVARNLSGDGKNYTFVLTDLNYNGIYELIYISDKAPYDQTWKIKKRGEKISSDISYVMAEIEYLTGNRVVLAPPVNDSVYSSGSSVGFMGVVEGSGGFEANETVNITLKDEEGNIINSTEETTSGNGIIVSNFSAPAEPGNYYIYINDTPVDVFSVETFKLFGKVTDLTGTPTYTFSQNPKIKVSSKVKDTEGNVLDNATVNISLTYPNATVSQAGEAEFNNQTGEYELDISSYLESAPNGEYKVSFYAAYDESTQIFLASFSIESVKMGLMAINPQFMEQAEGSEAMVDSFAPGGKVSLLVTLSDVSKGGLMESGPEEMGLVDIEGNTDGARCSDRINLVRIEDENKNAVDTSALNVTISNLSEAVTLLGLSGGDNGPEEEMLKQCMIIFDSPDKTGSYKIKVKLKHPTGEKTSEAMFGIQKVYATSNPVDFKGDDFWFYAPNSTLRIKIKLMDLSNHTDISSNNILDAKIVEMNKVWPDYRDVLSDGTYNPNASASNGTIVFTSPDSEGFFMFKFRFKVNLSGDEVIGTGNGYFMLKKYLIWGSPAGGGEGQEAISGYGENVTLNVRVADVSKGSQMDLGQSNLDCDDSDNDGLPDCDGLEVTIGELWNDQMMKKMNDGVNYNVSKAAIRNSTASLVVTPVDLPTGWYHADLILTDKLTNDTYFGWAYFEVRNFWVNTMPIAPNENGTLVLSMNGGGRGAFGVGDEILFAVNAQDPTHKGYEGQRLTIDSVTLDDVRFMSGNSMVSLDQDDYTATATSRPVLIQQGEGGFMINMTVVNLTILNNKTGGYMLNMRVNCDSGSDTGTYKFQIASFMAQLTYRGMDNWPVMFAPDETIEINVTASDFDENPVTLNATRTKVRSIWNEKTKNQIKIPDGAANTTCNENNCTITLNLTTATGGQAGRYNIGLEIGDTSGNTVEDGIYFEARGIMVSIPNINEVWVNQQTDTSTKEINVDNDRDNCANTLNLRPDDVPEANGTIVIMSMPMPLNLTVSQKYNGSDYAMRFCLTPQKQWNMFESGSCTGVDEENYHVSYFASNTTSAWFDTDTDFTDANELGVGDTFEVGGITWIITNISQNRIVIGNAGGVCGNRQACTGQGENRTCNQEMFALTAPDGSENFDTFYFGYLNNMIGSLENGGDWFIQQYPAFVAERPAYIYHNTTHVWLTNSTNLSEATPAAVGEVINDPYGGIWNVSQINRNKVTLIGQNILASTGAFIDTSLSRSGYILVAAVNEQQLGAWDKNSGQQKGIDINNDGSTESKVYFAISDNSTSGVYDTFFYTNTSNFSTALPAGGSMGERTFGEGESMTLLSISPDADRVRLYGRASGDMSELGELKIGNNVRIPIVVKSPSGEDATANVTLDLIRGMTGEIVPRVSVSGDITGIGELAINLSQALNVSSEASGKYVFGLSAKPEGQEKDIMEEWRWPFVTMRSFLVDSSFGSAGYITGFKNVSVTRYGGETYGWIPELRSAERNGINYTGVFADPGGDQSGECSNFVRPAGVNVTAPEWSMRLQGQNFWMYINAGNNSKAWFKNGNCNFSQSQPVPVNGAVNVTMDGKVYKLYLLGLNNTPGNQGAVIGVKGLNASVISPVRIDNDQPRWNIMSLNLSGTLYMVVLANDSAEYPMCTVWGGCQCAKVAWFDTDGDFSNAIKVSAGENFTSDLYLSSIGPGSWDGLTIANKSGLSAVPALGVRINGGSAWFAAADESALGLDLNIDNSTDSTYYIAIYDDRGEGQMNRIIADDDLNITEEWWSDNDRENPTYYDFYGTEAGARESGGNLPNALWKGNVRFGEQSQNENQNPNWEISFFNNSHMFISKNRDTYGNPYGTTENLSIIVRAYGFDQAPISNATVSIERIMVNSPLGSSELSPSDYTVTITPGNNRTDSQGYAIVEIEPTTAWQAGDYMVQIKVVSGSITERKTWWMRIGQQAGGMQ